MNADEVVLNTGTPERGKFDKSFKAFEYKMVEVPGYTVCLDPIDG